ncbi:hypothetical protein [Fischerella sp. PCC 9605]|uniref:hypothetical protein n=1 Tax=Fischerella sp. PCC 9605 TaxID=1173024 RepID=UPI0004B4C68F|nr:hypothetical protein [Fischerella sp. PCC 9605]
MNFEFREAVHPITPSVFTTERNFVSVDSYGQILIVLAESVVASKPTESTFNA